MSSANDFSRRPFRNQLILTVQANVFIAVVLTSLAACENGGPAETQGEVWDSAGIQIIETAEPPETWFLAEEPSLRIGILDGDPAYQLYRVAHAARLEDGSVVIFDGGSGEVRFFDASGQFLYSTGGQGEGPGEFRSFTTLTEQADTFFVQDRRNRRVTTVTPGGEIGVAWPLDTHAAFSTGGQLLGPVHDGSALVQAGVALPQPSQEGFTYRRDSVSLLRVDLETGSADTLAVFPGEESTQWLGQRRGRWVMMPNSGYPFGHSTHLASHIGEVLVGETEPDQVTVLGPDGSIRKIIRKGGWVPGVVSPEYLEAYRRGILGPANETPSDMERERQEALDEQLALVPESHTIPRFDDLRIDALGRIWIQDFVPVPRQAEARTWEVLDPGGQALARIEVPAWFRIFQIGEDEMVGVARDSLDVEYVEVRGFGGEVGVGR